MLFIGSDPWPYGNITLKKKIGKLYQHICWFWLVVYLPLWKIMEFVSWDDDIPTILGKIKHGAVEIVDVPINSMGGSFHGKMLVHQRVININ